MVPGAAGTLAVAAVDAWVTEEGEAAIRRRGAFHPRVFSAWRLGSFGWSAGQSNG